MTPPSSTAGGGSRCWSSASACRHHARQHDPQRRAPDARAPGRRGGSARPRVSCSGSSTPTSSSSPASCSPPGAWVTASAATGARLRASPSSGSARACPRSPASATAHRDPRTMGIGGAFIMPATLSIITNVFTDPAERGRAIGVWAGCPLSASASARSPAAAARPLLVGLGLPRQRPDVILALVLGFLLVPESSDPQAAARPGWAHCCRSPG